MKKLSVLLLISMFAVFLSASGSVAYQVGFGDDAIFWPTWGNGTSDDTKDVIGVPNINPSNMGGIAQFSDITPSLLEQISFTLSGYSSLVAPGDLFLSTDGDDTNWEYVVDITDWDTSMPSNPVPSDGDYELIPVSLSSTNPSPGYIVVAQSDWGSYAVREGHPAAYDVPYDSSADDVEFTGWPGINPLGEYYPTFNFANAAGVTGVDGIPLTGALTIGWTVNCANDVIFQDINPVPEPATMILFGLGLIGLGGAGRYLKRKKG